MEKKRETGDRGIFAALILLVLIGAGLAYWLLLGRTPSGPPAPPLPPAVKAPQEVATPLPPPAVADLRVARVNGPVRIRHAGPKPAWSRVKVGDVLRKDDTVETGRGGAVELAAGESYQVTLDEQARFAVREITAELSRFGLANGLLNANVRDDPRRVVEIESAAGGLARTRGAELSVAGTDTGVAVGVRRGEAELTSQGRSVVIRAGQEALAMKGEPPSEALPIPSSLLLKVAWPSERVTTQRKLIVTGKTSPGAVVALGDRLLHVGLDGKFREIIYLREGAQKLSATARDVGGHRTESEGPSISLRSKNPKAWLETGPLWEWGSE